MSNLSSYFHDLDCQVDKNFTVEMGLSLQKSINVINLLINFIKENGKEMLDVLNKKNIKFSSEGFEYALFFLDGLMD